MSEDVSTNITISKNGAIADVGGAICRECGRGLDENGMFPEEG